VEQYEIFQTVVDRVKEAIAKGDDVRVPLKDLDTMSRLYVKARIAENAEALDNAVPLTVVNDMGEKVGRLFIAVGDELDDDEIAALPTQ
jgi:hypothetical protein